MLMDHPHRFLSGPNSRFCSLHRRKEEKKCFALTRRKKTPPYKHKNTSKKHKTPKKRREKHQQQKKSRLRAKLTSRVKKKLISQSTLRGMKPKTNPALLTGACCQFGHGVGGFKINFIHSLFLFFFNKILVGPSAKN